MAIRSTHVHLPGKMRAAPQRRVAYTQPKPQGPFGKFVEAIGNFLLEYWAHIITVAFGTIVFLAISVPFLSYFGLDSIAKPIFYSLHYVCAQIPSHSFYVFGHQLGLCARNFSIYTSMFLMSLIFILSKKRLPGLPWWIWILLLLPMAWDGITQMFGLRESSWELRLLTGTLFGIGNIWFALPLMQKSLIETTVPPMYSYAQLQQQALQSAAGQQVAVAYQLAQSQPSVSTPIMGNGTQPVQPSSLSETAPTTSEQDKTSSSSTQ